ncbi:MAG: thermonuclease family protein [Vallitaleaceae bacterium]|nr:thermonuclease family protein [Vallitaleaceae bacterium]
MEKYQVRIKSRYLLFLTLLVLLLSNVGFVQARGIIPEVEQPQVAIVTNIIDGEVIQVVYLSSLKNEPKTEAIRMIGIDTEADDDTFLYVKNQLLGKVVYILKENISFPKEEAYLNAYVYKTTEESFNAHLLKQGLAKIADGFERATQFEEFLELEAYAYHHGLGKWNISTSTDEIININLASKEMLMQHFEIKDSVATEILNYRRINPIDRYEEIGYIHDSFDKNFIEKFRSSIHFITSINSAGLYELSSIIGNTNNQSIAQEIYQKRLFSPFQNLSELKEIANFKPLFSAALPFLSLEDASVNVEMNDVSKVANINTASPSEITIASGIAIDLATVFTNYRDLHKITSYNLSQWSMGSHPWISLNLSAYIDRLHSKTDINNSGVYELNTLFSKSALTDNDRNLLVDKIIKNRPYYNFQSFSNMIGESLYAKVKDYIEIPYVNMSSKKPININTAEKASVISYLGLDEKNAKIYQSYSSKYTNFNQVNFTAGGNQSLITLYTNINEASYDELMNMSKYMTDSLVRKIIARRALYPFYSKSELEDFFKEIKMQYIYTALHSYIVFY